MQLSINQSYPNGVDQRGRFRCTITPPNRRLSPKELHNILQSQDCSFPIDEKNYEINLNDLDKQLSHQLQIVYTAMATKSNPKLSEHIISLILFNLTLYLFFKSNKVTPASSKQDTDYVRQRTLYTKDGSSEPKKRHSKKSQTIWSSRTKDNTRFLCKMYALETCPESADQNSLSNQEMHIFSTVLTTLNKSLEQLFGETSTQIVPFSSTRMKEKSPWEVLINTLQQGNKLQIPIESVINRRSLYKGRIPPYLRLSHTNQRPLTLTWSHLYQPSLFQGLLPITMRLQGRHLLLGMRCLQNPRLLAPVQSPQSIAYKALQIQAANLIPKLDRLCNRLLKQEGQPNSHASLNHFKNEKHLLEHLRDHELHTFQQHLNDQCPPKSVFNASGPVQDALQVINSGLEQLEKNITQSHHILSKDEYVQQKIQVTQLLESIIEKLDKHNSISEEEIKSILMSLNFLCTIDDTFDGNPIWSDGHITKQLFQLYVHLDKQHEGLTKKALNLYLLCSRKQKDTHHESLLLFYINNIEKNRGVIETDLLCHQFSKLLEVSLIYKLPTTQLYEDMAKKLSSIVKSHPHILQQSMKYFKQTPVTVSFVCPPMWAPSPPLSNIPTHRLRHPVRHPVQGPDPNMFQTATTTIQQRRTPFIPMVLNWLKYFR